VVENMTINFLAFQCSDVSELSSKLHGAAGFHSKLAPEGTNAGSEKADPAVVPETSTSAQSITEDHHELSSSSSPLVSQASTPAPDENSSASFNVSRERRDVQDRCFLVYRPDLKEAQKNNTEHVPGQRNTSWQGN
jgi:hypothetical protein